MLFKNLFHIDREFIFNKNIKTITIGLILVYLILIKGDVPLGNEVNYVQHTYKISNMVYVDGNQEGIPKLGKGIISEKNMKYIRTYKEMKEKLMSRGLILLVLLF